MRISDWSSDVCSSDLDQSAPSDDYEKQIDRPVRRAGMHGRAFCALELDGAEQNCAECCKGDAGDLNEDPEDRKSVVEGKRVSVRVELGGRGIIKKKKRHAHDR